MSSLKDLARECGVSVATVSKALNGQSDISAATRDRVREAARRMGYVPNMAARAMKTNRTYNLGVLFVDERQSGLAHEYFSAVLDSFKVQVEKLGYDITFVNRNLGGRTMTYLEHCHYRGVDGAVIACVDFNDPQVVELVNSDVPVVTIDHVFHDHTCVQSQNRQGMEELTRYVIARGHRRIAYVTGEESSVTDVRTVSFLRAMNEAGLDVPPGCLVPAAYHNPAVTREATLRLLKQGPRPTCILMPDDYAALGGMEAVRACGLRIPEDVSVAGFDGVKLLQMCAPALTTVEQDTQRIGSEAARQLVHLIEHPRTTYHELITIPCRLLEGATVARPSTAAG